MIDVMYILEKLLADKFETEVVEFKTAANSYDFEKIGMYFSALSNEANLKDQKFAWLVFGVEDKSKSVVGTNYRRVRNELNKLKKGIADKTTNRITFVEIHELEFDKKRVLLFQIPPAPKGIPIAWSGHYYGRDNESLVALNLEELERIRSQRTDEDWSMEICEGADIEDLSEEAIAKARSLFAAKNPALKDETAGWDDFTFLNKAKICIQGKITRAAILLLGKPESEHFLSPGHGTITWILKDKDNQERDYEHFGCPLLLSVEKVYQKIRVLKYRYLKEGTLFPEEVDSYDPYIIREALNNCIAHQDYTLGGKINVIEWEDSQLMFTNLGSFIPGTIENVIRADAPESRYRNAFLAGAMVQLSMIDTIGSGIKRMFIIQKNKFFPLPEYSFPLEQVHVRFTGKILDMSYARKLAQMPELRLEEIILLDKIQKGTPLSDLEIAHLKKRKLIEGRKPNFHISENVAEQTGQIVDYLKLRGIDNGYIQTMIVELLKKKKSHEAKRTDFEALLMDKLSDTLDEKQKRDKIKNVLQQMKKSKIVVSIGKSWRLFNSAMTKQDN